MAADDGGPAFPHSGEVHTQGGIHSHSQCGMSLRDWFAGQCLGEQQAMVGLAIAEYPDSAEERAQVIARAAYLVADAMLAARKA